MAHETIIYGSIEGATYTANEYRKYQHINAEIIRTLPDEDEYPFLSRHMFSFPPADVCRGTFRTQIIHFGASIKGLEWEEVDVWIVKFEGLLKRLYWFEATVHIKPEIDSPYLFTWVPKVSPVSTHNRHGKLLPVTEWVREKQHDGTVTKSP
ncbi:MAG: hypothetical protein AAGF95_15280 [Chloroflexota bacterium]